jgi:HK97 family phage major capsid protein/HK97 family phage prohead protease
MNRAYSVLDVKSVDTENRIIRGTATTPTPDRMGDIVEPLGVEFKNPMPLLWQHQADKPVGTVKFDKPTKNGITFEARLAQIDEPGTLKDRIDEAWQSVKAGLVSAVSIGFRALEYAFIEGTGGIRFEKSEVMELSLVTIPANADATISQIKSIDTAIRAATGISDGEGRPVPPGVTGKSPTKPVKLRPKEAKPMSKTIQEQIAALEAKRAATAARMTEIMQKSVDEGRTSDAAEQEEFDNLEAEMAPIDADLKRFKALEKAQIATAKPVQARNMEEGSVSRSSAAPVQIKTNHPKGTGFIRLIGAKWLSTQQYRPAADIAKEMFHDTPEVEMLLRSGIDATNIADLILHQKTAVAPLDTTTSGAASQLVVATNLASEFFEMLRAATIIGRLPSLRRVPFNISVPRALTDPTGYWVGQGDNKPVSSMTFDSVSLPFHKVAGIVPLTEELFRFSNPAAEGIIRDALVGALTYRVDRDFLDPSKSETTGINPASVTNGVTPITASGTTAAAFRADLGDLIATYLGLNMSPAGLVLVMTSSQAMRLGLMRNTLGNKEFPDIGVNGGSIEGIPVITSENIVATGGSPTDGYPIIALNARDILVADDGGVSIDISREASLQMNDAPDSPETTSTVLVSLWQRNLVGIKAERFITWKKGRTGAVQFIQNAKYEES